MNILITGAAGGIGSTLARKLNKNDNKLYLIDNLRNGYEENLYENGELIGEWINISIEDDLSELWKDIEFDHIIHMAAVTALPDCENNKEESLSINVNGTLNLLNFAKDRGCSSFIFAGTSAIYENNSGTLDESLETNPTLLYSLTKKMAEGLCNAYRENYKMNITTLRFFNVFGPRQDIHRTSPPLLNYLVREFSNNRQPILHSDGNQSRDYVHVDDVVRMVEMCMEQLPNDTFNICSGTKVSVKEIVETVKDALQTDIEPIYRESHKLWDSYPELFEGDYPLLKEVVSKETNKSSLGTWRKAFSELGWQPRINIKELMKETTIQMIMEKV
jgi:nucleoside-diphosphate-sugar epimerase